MAQCTCEKCGRTMDESNFYLYRDGTRCEMCKKCLTMHVDPLDTETFLWLLQKFDVPYIEDEWNVLINKAKDPTSGTAIFGKYLSKMKLVQYKKYRWADSEKLKFEREQKKKELGLDAESIAERNREVQRQFEAGLISEAEYMTLTSLDKQNEDNQYRGATEVVVNGSGFDESQLIPEEDLLGEVGELTQEDKMYLAMKWGRYYKPLEWITLEKKYAEMKDSFDIQDSDTDGTLILICKTYLKMNQSIDCGDLDGYQKLSRTYDTLRKSAKFTAAQNKEQNGDFVNAAGQIVAYCEEHKGQIPRFKIDTPLDIVDKVIDDMKQYNRNLVYTDAALARQIEEYLKKREVAEQQKKDKEEAKKQGLTEVQVSDEDMKENLERIEAEKAEDEVEYSEQPSQEIDFFDKLKSNLDISDLNGGI